MGLLNQTQQEYYNGIDHGNYQFTSLDDVINQFLVVYVGEGKIIPKASRTDVQFHAMRAMQELSFDTFKSTKSQEIVLPPSLQMTLPQDYVNYTRVGCVDENGIIQNLYSTKHTSNPFSIKQDEDGGYDFSFDEFLTDNSFERNNGLHSRWSKTTPINGAYANSITRIFGQGSKIKLEHRVAKFNRLSSPGVVFTGVDDPAHRSLQFQHVSRPVNIGGGNIGHDSDIQGVWHKVDTRGINFLDISGSARMFDATTHNSLYGTSGSVITGTGDVSNGNMKIGLQSMLPDTNQSTIGNGVISENLQDPDLGFMEWTSGDTSITEKSLEQIDVSAYNEVYFVIFSTIPLSSEQRLNWDGTTATPYVVEDYMIDTSDPLDGTLDAFDNDNFPVPIRVPYQHVFTNIVTDVSCVKTGSGSGKLNPRDQSTGDSTAWSKYKASTNNTNNENTYDTDYNLNYDTGQRYGLSPEHAQNNGSFYIDHLRGSINFSSNISGKTVILDYISDSLGTDDEMQVHKFAEEAIYKSIVCDIMSTRANVPEYAIRRYKKEKSSSKRTAKLRLSNIKIQDITQIFRNKSKQIK